MKNKSEDAFKSLIDEFESDPKMSEHLDAGRELIDKMKREGRLGDLIGEQDEWMVVSSDWVKNVFSEIYKLRESKDGAACAEKHGMSVSLLLDVARELENHAVAIRYTGTDVHGEFYAEHIKEAYEENIRLSEQLRCAYPAIHAVQAHQEKRIAGLEAQLDDRRKVVQALEDVCLDLEAQLKTAKRDAIADLVKEILADKSMPIDGRYFGYENEIKEFLIKAGEKS